MVKYRKEISSFGGPENRKQVVGADFLKLKKNNKNCGSMSSICISKRFLQDVDFSNI